MTAPIKSHRARYYARRELALTAGTWQPFVGAGPVAEHIGRLRSAGMSHASIAAAAGIQECTVFRIWSRQQDKVFAATARAIHAVGKPIDVAPDNRHIPSVGTARRIRALQVLGWTTDAIGEQVGMSRSHISAMCRLQDGVTAARARQIRAVYNRLSRQVGPSKLTRDRAIARGWASPAAWDDIDDPNAQPIGVRHHTTTRARREDVVEDVADLLRGRDTMEQIAARLGLTVSALERNLYRASRPDLVTLARTDPEFRRAAS